MSTNLMAAIRQFYQDEQAVSEYVSKFCNEDRDNLPNLVSEILVALQHRKSEVVEGGLSAANWIFTHDDLLRYTAWGEQLKAEALRLLSHRHSLVVSEALGVLDDYPARTARDRPDKLGDGRWLKSREVMRAIEPLIYHRNNSLARIAVEMLRKGKRLQQG